MWWSPKPTIDGPHILGSAFVTLRSIVTSASQSARRAASRPARNFGTLAAVAFVLFPAVAMGRPPRDGSLLARRVLLGAQEVQRDVGFVADDPRIVGDGRHVEEVARRQLDDPSVLELDGRRSREDHARVLDRAALGADDRADVFGPLPPRLVRGAPDRLRPEAHEVEAAAGEAAGLVRLLEALEDHLVHDGPPATSRAPSPGAPRRRAPCAPSARRRACP